MIIFCTLRNNDIIMIKNHNNYVIFRFCDSVTLLDSLSTVLSRVNNISLQRIK